MLAQNPSAYLGSRSIKAALDVANFYKQLSGWMRVEKLLALLKLRTLML